MRTYDSWVAEPSMGAWRTGHLRFATEADQESAQVVFRCAKSYMAEPMKWYNPMPRSMNALLFVGFTLQSMISMLRQEFCERPYFWRIAFSEVYSEQQKGMLEGFYHTLAAPWSSEGWLPLALRPSLFYPYLLSVVQTFICLHKIEAFYDKNRVPLAWKASWHVLLFLVLNGNFFFLGALVTCLLIATALAMCLNVVFCVVGAFVACVTFLCRKLFCKRSLAEEPRSRGRHESARFYVSAAWGDLGMLINVMLLCTVSPCLMGLAFHRLSSDTYLCSFAKLVLFDLRPSGDNRDASQLEFIILWFLCCLPLVVLMWIAPRNFLVALTHPALTMWTWMCNQARYSLVDQLMLSLSNDDRALELVELDLRYVHRQHVLPEGVSERVRDAYLQQVPDGVAYIAVDTFPGD